MLFQYKKNRELIQIQRLFQIQIHIQNNWHAISSYDNKYIHAMFSCLFILLVVGYILTKLYFVLDFDCLMRLSFVVGPHWLSMFHVADW